MTKPESLTIAGLLSIIGISVLVGVLAFNRPIRTPSLTVTGEANVGSLVVGTNADVAGRIICRGELRLGADAGPGLLTTNTGQDLSIPAAGAGTLAIARLVTITSNANVTGTVAIGNSSTLPAATVALDIFHKNPANTFSSANAAWRVQTAGSPYNFDTWVNGHLFTNRSVFISGHTTESGGNSTLIPTSLDTLMLSIHADCEGPCIQMVPSNVADPVLETLDYGGNYPPQKHKFAMTANGSMMWGDSAKLYNTGKNWTVAVATNVVTLDTIADHGCVAGGVVHFVAFVVNTFLNDHGYAIASIPTTHTMTFTLLIPQTDQGAIAENATGSEAASLKGRYDVGLCRSAAGMLKVCDGGAYSGALDVSYLRPSIGSINLQNTSGNQEIWLSPANGRIGLGSVWTLDWGNSYTPSNTLPDSGITRVAPASLKITNGGSGYGALTVSKLNAGTGAAGSTGTATVNGLTGVRVSTTAVTASSIIIVSYNTPKAAAAGLISAPVASIIVGTSFVIFSTDATDTTSTVNWWCLN